MSAATKSSIEERETTLSDLLDRAERGEEVTISRQGRPVARLVPAAPAHDPEKARQAVQRIFELRDKIRAEHGPVSLEEILASRHEGHRY